MTLITESREQLSALVCRATPARNGISSFHLRTGNGLRTRDYDWGLGAQIYLFTRRNGESLQRMGDRLYAKKHIDKDGQMADTTTFDNIRDEGNPFLDLLERLRGSRSKVTPAEEFMAEATKTLKALQEEIASIYPASEVVTTVEAAGPSTARVAANIAMVREMGGSPTPAIEWAKTPVGSPRDGDSTDENDDVGRSIRTLSSMAKSSGDRGSKRARVSEEVEVDVAMEDRPPENEIAARGDIFTWGISRETSVGHILSTVERQSDTYDIILGKGWLYRDGEYSDPEVPRIIPELDDPAESDGESLGDTDWEEEDPELADILVQEELLNAVEVREWEKRGSKN
ncbi:hypothetical protein GQ53DRAFT_763184 [Thozetella sp. PMI_491]|nr:hypothetical protein GQ53DRAFT_763184 [Thozetella sp. PMI_491]